MLQFIRSKVTSIFIKVLFGILILSFAIWGIGDIFLGNKDGEAVISIGDKDYNANEFLSEYEKARRAMRLPPEYEDLVNFNEYKRRQVPLGIKISARNFGKDRRYPITNFWKNNI